MLTLKTDCRHFPGDRPCTPHKQTGIKCDSCTQYEPVDVRIVIIKLEAVGDVLRTTCILPGLREKYPKGEIFWVTQPEAVPLFHENPLVDRVLPYGSMECQSVLAVEHFDLLINVDAAPKSAALASYSNAKSKIGFGVTQRGDIMCFNPEAETWLHMGAFDDVKKQNTLSYQQLMLNICGLKPSSKEIQLSLNEDELMQGDQFRRQHGIGEGVPVVGLNTGASGRWEMKKWTFDGYRAVIQKLLEETPAHIVLYGGVIEYERNTALAKGFPDRLTIADTRHSLRSLFAILNISDVVVTGDTLALHAATALGKRVVAIFGPTSSAEIEPYDRVTKITSATMACKCYYKPVCDQDVNCMNTIPPQQVFDVVTRELAGIRRI